MKPLLAASLLLCAALCHAQTSAAQPAPAEAATSKAPSQSLEAAATERNNTEIRRLLAEYRESLRSDAALAPLWEKCPTAPNEATAAQLARTDKISSEDSERMNEVARRTERYQQEVYRLLVSLGVGEPLLQAWSGGGRAAAKLRQRLTDRLITWGQYNTRLRDLTTAHRMALADTADALELKDEKKRAQGVERASRDIEQAYARALGR